MSVASLVENLESQVEMHLVLLDVLKQENNLPASCSLLELQDIQSVRDSTVKRIAELEHDRLSIIQQLTAEFSLAGNISLKDIVDHCEEKYKRKLVRLRKQLTEVISQIQAASKKNAEKAVARIACFRELHNSIHKSFHRHPVYSMKGIMTQPKGACLIKRSI